MSTTCFPTSFHSIKSSFSIKCFSQTKASMCLIHECKILTFLDILKVLVSDSSNVITSDHQSIVFCNSGDDFILLSLILNDWLLDSIVVFKLFTIACISCGCYDCNGINFGWGTTDMLTDWHHCGVTYFWVAFLLYLTCTADWCETTQHVFLRNYDVMQNKIPIIFGMESNFRTDISSFDSWNNIMVIVSDLNKKSMNSMFNT